RDDVYRRRRHALRSDDGDFAATPLTTWHPDLPPEPPGLPDRASIELLRGEGEFVLDRLRCAHPHSLLRELADGPPLPDVEYPWLHPELDGFDRTNRRV